MNFYCITKNVRNTSYIAFSEICKEKGINFIGLNPFKTNVLSLNIQKGDLVYRIADNKAANLLEKYILDKGAVGFYKDSSKINLLQDGFLAFFENQKLPSPKTIVPITASRKILREYVEYLGGFPVILKVLGGSLGRGVIKIESFDSLFSVAGYLKEQFPNKEIALKEFIEHKEQLRLVVLGKRVLFGYARFKSKEDFRTNFGGCEKDFCDPSNEIKKIAVQAVDNMNLEFGGVDILIEEKTGKPFLAEVNFPSALKVSSMMAKEKGIDIEREMIEFLIKKAKNI